MPAGPRLLVAALAIACAPKSEPTLAPTKTMDPDRLAIREVVKTRLGETQRCYNRALKENPSLRGRVTFELTIDAQGFVREAAIVTSDMPKGDVPACVAAMAKDWRFPARPGDTDETITFSVVFST